MLVGKQNLTPIITCQIYACEFLNTIQQYGLITTFFYVYIKKKFSFRFKYWYRWKLVLGQIYPFMLILMFVKHIHGYMLRTYRVFMGSYRPNNIETRKITESSCPV